MSVCTLLPSTRSSLRRKPVGGFEPARGWSGAPVFDQRVLGLRCSRFRSAFTERAVFDHFRSYVTVPTSDLWAGKPGSDFPKVFSFDEAAAMRQRTLDTGEYTDSHVWMFTPAVFVDQIV